MFNIANYLEKIKKVGLDSFLIKEEIIKILKEKTGLAVNKNDIKIQNGLIYINCRPVYKNAIYIAKNHLLEEINKKTNKNFLDIR